MFALVKEGIVVKYPYNVSDAKRDNPSVSFSVSPDDASMAAIDAYRVYFTTQPTPSSGEVVEEKLPIFNSVSQRWEQNWIVRNKSIEEINAEMESVRYERGRLLSETDWTQLADAPVDKAAWTVYRQALRDIPSQPGFPHNVIWPSIPN